MKMKKLMAVGLVCMMVFATAACGSGDKGKTTDSKSSSTDKKEATEKLTGSITGSGSSALLPLAQHAADMFKKTYPDVSITLNGGGSGTGLKQVSEGSVTIGNSDVEAESKLEADKAKELVDHKVCVITMATIANKDVTDQVDNLTKQQLADIFTGKIKNWSEVGGPDEEVVLVTRPSTSGTRALYREYALDGQEEASNVSLETDDSGTLLQSVSSQKGAIGYIALSYLVDIDQVGTIAIDGVEPTLENTYNGTYPVWGYEHMYTKGEAEGAAKEYIDYIMSDEFGKEIEAMGYNVASKMKVTR